MSVTEAPAAIVFDDVYKRTAVGEDLNRLRFTVKQGECCALVGSSGSGKNTAAALLKGLCPADAGTCQIMGKDCFSQARKIHELVDFVTTGTVFPPNMHVGRYLSLLQSWRGEANADKTREIIEKLEIVPFGLFRKMTDENLRKFSLLIGLMRDKRILIFDEPFAGLSAGAQEALYELIEEEKREGKTILLLTHVPEQARRLCERAALMRGGRVLVEQTAPEMNLQRRKVYHIVFKDGGEALRFSQVWGENCEVADDRVTVAVPGSPKALISALSECEILDFYGGTDAETREQDGPGGIKE